MERLRRKVKLKFIPFSYPGFLLPLLGATFMFRAGRSLNLLKCPVGFRLGYGTRAESLQSWKATNILMGTVSEDEVYGLE